MLLGENTIIELESQNETLQESKSKVDSIKDMAQSARTAIRNWQFEIVKKKVFLWIIVSVLFVLDLSLYIYMVKHDGRLL